MANKKIIKKPNIKIVYRTRLIPKSKQPDYAPYIMGLIMVGVICLILGHSIGQYRDFQNDLGDALCKARLGEDSGYLQIIDNGLSTMQLICVTGKEVITFDPIEIAEQKKDVLISRLICESDCRDMGSNDQYNECISQC